MSAQDEIPLQLGVIIATLSQRILLENEECELTRLLENLAKTESSDNLAKLKDVLNSANSCLSEAHRLAALLHLNLFHLKWQRRVIPSQLLTLSKKTLANELKQLNQEAKQLLLGAYRERYSQDPLKQLSEISKYRAAQRLTAALGSSTALNNTTTANSKDDTIEKSVKKLKHAIRAKKAGIILNLFHDADSHFRTEIINSYSQINSPETIASDLKRSFRKLEAEIIEEIVYFGQVTPAKLLYCAVAGIGTDEASIRMVLQNCSANERDLAAKEFFQVWEEHCPWYERPFPGWFGDLYRRLMLECGGDCWFDLSQYFTHNNDHSLAELERLLHWYEHERSGSLLAKRKSDFRDGQLLAARASKAESLLRQSKDLSERENTSGVLITLTTCNALECELEIFRDRKHLAGNTLSAAISAPIATTTLLSLGALGADLWKLMIGVGVASGGARILLKNSIKGRGYHREELTVDLLYSVLDGVTLFANRIFRHFVLRSGTRFAAKLTFRLGLSRSLKPAYLQAWLKAISDRSTLCNLQELATASAISSQTLLDQLRVQIAPEKEVKA